MRISDWSSDVCSSDLAILGASPGGFGTVLAQNHWLPVLRTLGVTLWTGGRMLIPRASGVFDATGVIGDPAVRDQLQAFLAGYAASLRHKDDRTDGAKNRGKRFRRAGPQSGSAHVCTPVTNAHIVCRLLL